jgi:hypothetical protein
MIVYVCAVPDVIFYCIQLNEKYNEFVMSEDIEGLMTKLQEVEDWLYEDGEDETKGVYVAKLEELKKVCLLHCTVCLRVCCSSR